MVDGLIISKIRYNLGVVGNLWVGSQYSDKNFKFTTFTKTDNQRLQVILNKSLKLALGIKKQNIPTEELLKRANKLSIHQETAYQVAFNVKKIIEMGRPMYLSEQFKKNQAEIQDIQDLNQENQG